LSGEEAEMPSRDYAGVGAGRDQAESDLNGAAESGVRGRRVGRVTRSRTKEAGSATGSPI
jgi:hypothetical protein